MLHKDLRDGVDNLLINCGELRAGDTLLVLHEDPRDGYYDQDVADAVMARAAELGIDATLSVLAFDPLQSELCDKLIRSMQAADRTLFLSRTGDQIRFDDSMRGIRPIMSYTLDAEMLASGMGRAPYQGFVALKDAINALLADATRVRVTCALGSDFSGPGVAFPPTGAEDVTVKRFPLSVFAPVPAERFSGVVVQSGFLTGTGSKRYEPYTCTLRNPIAVRIQGTSIVGIEGDAADVQAAHAHYARVAALFNLNPMTVHSWHAGIHPGCSYATPRSSKIEQPVSASTRDHPGNTD
ncbi:MAG: hypothetical protein AAF499_18950 [Pseudomonadota bacterium]